MDPFALALDAMFQAPGSERASYVSNALGLISDDVRVIRGQPDKVLPFGDGRVIQGTNLFEIRKSDVDCPAKGDLVLIDDRVFKLLGEPILDVEGLTWSIGAEEISG